MKNNHKTWRYILATIILVLGIILESLNIGKEFLGFNSIGIWLIYVGFIMLAVTSLQFIKNKKRIVDERMISIAYKASRITFLVLIIISFLIMVLDGIKQIQIPYSLFMSYFICFMMMVYFISYKILEKYN